MQLLRIVPGAIDAQRLDGGFQALAEQIGVERRLADQRRRQQRGEQEREGATDESAHGENCSRTRAGESTLGPHVRYTFAMSELVSEVATRLGSVRQTRPASLMKGMIDRKVGVARREAAG